MSLIHSFQWIRSLRTTTKTKTVIFAGKANLKIILLFGVKYTGHYTARNAIFNIQIIDSLLNCMGVRYTITDSKLFIERLLLTNQGFLFEFLSES